MKYLNNKDIIFPLFCWSILFISFINVLSLLGSYPNWKLFLYWFLKIGIYLVVITSSFNLVYYVHTTILNRILPAFAIGMFLFSFQYVLDMQYQYVEVANKVTETDMIASTFVDRSKMSYMEKRKLIDDLRPHFRTAVSSSIKTRDCNSVDDFLDHLQVSTLTRDMTYNEKVEKVATAYILSYCKRRK